MASRKTSAVWTHFEKEGEAKVKCLLCLKTFAYSSNTTNMLKHLERAHPDASKVAKETTVTKQTKTKQPVQSSINNTLFQAIPYGRNSIKKQQIDRLLVEMIALDMQPLSIVEDVGFKRLLKGMDSRYEPPSRKHITQTLLPARCKTERERVKAELELVSDVSITTDIWTSRATQGYITVTAHFLNQLWHLESLVLETCVIEGDHTGDVIAATLKDIVKEWNISDKIRVVISDNAANITAAFKKLGWRHVPCTAHCLHLVVKHALDSDETVKGIVKKVKEIAGYFHKSVKATDRLVQLQQEAGEEKPKKLKQECETRWNSTYTMLQRFVTIRRYVHTVLTLLNKGAMCISDDELSLIESTLKVLQPFLEATEQLSGDKYPSMCLVLQLIKSLQEILIAQTVGARHFLLAEELLKQMRKYFINHERSFYVAAACVLDPRIKKVPFSSDNTYNVIHQRLVAELQALNSSTGATAGAIAIDDTSAAGTEVPRPGSLWDSFDRRVEALAHSRTPQCKCRGRTHQLFKRSYIVTYIRPIAMVESTDCCISPATQTCTSTPWSACDFCPFRETVFNCWRTYLTKAHLS